MGKLLTSAQLAERIRDERKKKEGLTLEQVGKWFGVSKQRIHQAEDPSLSGHRLDDLRVKILSRLLDGVEIVGPQYEITGQRALFDQDSEQKNRAA